MEKLHKEDLVRSAYEIISRKLKNEKIDSIYKIRVSSDEFIAYLKERYEITYHSPQHLWNQIRTYEKSIDAKLLEKTNLEQGYSLSVYFPQVSFKQKRHLHISQKIAISNGGLEYLHNHFHLNRKGPSLQLYLGAGTGTFYLAKMILESNPVRLLNLYTHNIGIITEYAQYTEGLENIDVYTPQGKLDRDTFTLLEGNENFINTVDFDVIFQGATYIKEGNLYLESDQELPIKKALLKQAKGSKILLLTSFENQKFNRKKFYKYGRISDYDYLITPKNKQDFVDEICPKKDCLPYIEYYMYSMYKIL